jgi:hypothetical protein
MRSEAVVSLPDICGSLGRCRRNDAPSEEGGKDRLTSLRASFVRMRKCLTSSASSGIQG